ncbi:MAG: GspE/PulE family protein [bacterium]|nr:GspE/PulE family protein [bacterium]
MQLSTERWEELLVHPGYVSAETFARVVAEACRVGRDIRDVCVDRGAMAEDDLGLLLAERHYGVPFIRAISPIPAEVLGLVPELVARSREVMPFAQTDAGVKLAMVHPDDHEVIHVIAKYIGVPVLPHHATPRVVRVALDQYHMSIREVLERLLRTVRDFRQPREERDRAVVEVVDALLQYGHENRASDISITLHRDHIRVSFRIDGMLHDAFEMPSTLQQALLVRVRMLAQLQTDAHRVAQDGKFRFSVVGDVRGDRTKRESTAAVRVSIVPEGAGERVVLRLLASHARQFSLQTIGLADDDLVRVHRQVSHPQGMLLVTGPTGSGITTTLYAMLTMLNRRGVRIATVEDPIAYDIEGVHQVSGGPRADRTFAQGIRAIVREDPDIIAVDALHDAETAGIAIEHAMANRLVFATLHADGAVDALQRLIAMGAAPFFVASALRGIIAQRLVRKLCTACRTLRHCSADEQREIARIPTLVAALERHGHHDLDRLSVSEGRGCDRCQYSGFSGRVGVFEVLEMTDMMRAMICTRASRDVLAAQTRQDGMTVLLDDAVAKALQGAITLAEVLHMTPVAAFPEDATPDTRDAASTCVFIR